MTTPPSYTSRFLTASSYSGGQPFICPLGYRAVLRHMDWTLTDAFSAALVHAEISGVQILRAALSLATNVYEFWDGYAVILEGERFDVVCSLGAVDVQCTGYLFQGA